MLAVLRRCTDQADTSNKGSEKRSDCWLTKNRKAKEKKERKKEKRERKGLTR